MSIEIVKAAVDHFTNSPEAAVLDKFNSSMPGVAVNNLSEATSSILALNSTKEDVQTGIAQLKAVETPLQITKTACSVLNDGANVVSDGFSCSGYAVSSALTRTVALTPFIGAVIGLTMDTVQLATRSDALHEKNKELRWTKEGSVAHGVLKTQRNALAKHVGSSVAAVTSDAILITGSEIPAFGTAADAISFTIGITRIVGERHVNNQLKKDLKAQVKRYEEPSIITPEGDNISLKDKHLRLQDNYEKAQTELHELSQRYGATSKALDDLYNRQRKSNTPEEFAKAVQEAEESFDALDSEFQAKKAEVSKLEQEFELSQMDFMAIDAAKKNILGLDPLLQKVEDLTHIKQNYEKRNPKVLEKDGPAKLRDHYEELLKTGTKMYHRALDSDSSNFTCVPMNSPRFGSNPAYQFRREPKQIYWDRLKSFPPKAEENTHYRRSYLTCQAAKNELSQLEAYEKACKELEKEQPKLHQKALNKLSKSAKPISSSQQVVRPLGEVASIVKVNVDADKVEADKVSDHIHDRVHQLRGTRRQKVRRSNAQPTQIHHVKMPSLIVIPSHTSESRTLVTMKDESPVESDFLTPRASNKTKTQQIYIDEPKIENFSNTDEYETALTTAHDHFIASYSKPEWINGKLHSIDQVAVERAWDLRYKNPKQAEELLNHRFMLPVTPLTAKQPNTPPSEVSPTAKQISPVSSTTPTALIV